MSIIDSCTVILYLVTTLGLGIFFGRNITTIKDYAISTKGFSNPIMVATLFATVIGGGSTCGIVTNVYRSGLIFMFAFFGAAINKLLVARYIASKVKQQKNCLSIGDIFQNHYGTAGKVSAGLCILFVSVACLGQQVIAIGFIFDQFFHIPLHWALLLGYGTMVAYSAFGGIRAVVATDVYQFIFMIAFIPVLFAIGMTQVGGIYGLLEAVPAEKLNPLANPLHYGKAATMFIVMTLSALDPSFIHRLIMSSDEEQAVYITKTTGSLSFPLFLIMGILGLIAYVSEPNLDPNLALPYLIDTFLPPLLRGLVVVALLAVIMSTADSNLHVVGLSVVQDLILPFSKKERTERQLVNLCRVVTIGLAIGGVCVALIFKDIFDIMIFAFGFWGPTVLVPFVFLLFHKVFTRNNLLVGILSGQLIVIAWNIYFKGVFWI